MLEFQSIIKFTKMKSYIFPFSTEVTEGDRVNLSNYLCADPSATAAQRVEQFIEEGNNFLINTHQNTLSRVAELSASLKRFRYFHHDLWKMYRAWKIAALRFFENNREVFDEEATIFGEVDTVPSVSLVEELPDFPCRYGVEQLQNIQREVIIKLRVLNSAKKKLAKRFISGEVRYISSQCLLVINGESLHLTQDSDEHLFCKLMFDSPPNTPIDWSDLYKEITGHDSARQGGAISRQRKKIRDTGIRLNKKIQNFFDTTEGIFVAKKKTIIRLF